MEIKLTDYTANLILDGILKQAVKDYHYYCMPKKCKGGEHIRKYHLAEVESFLRGRYFRTYFSLDPDILMEAIRWRREHNLSAFPNKEHKKLEAEFASLYLQRLSHYEV